MSTKQKLNALREVMAVAEVDAYFLPRVDEYQNEFLAAYAERLAWLTGFTGSAGFAAITADQARIFVDGRYTLQVRQEVPEAWAYDDYSKTRPTKWLLDQLDAGQVLGLEPDLITVAQSESLASAAEAKGVTIKWLDQNLIDGIWVDQPDKPQSDAFYFDTKYSGQSHEDKIAALATELKDNGLSHYFISDNENICWLLNLRGTDVPETPFCHAHAILNVATAHVYLLVESNKIGDALQKAWGKHVSLIAQDDIVSTLKGADKIGFDSGKLLVSHHLLLKETGVPLEPVKDPITLAKACKNKTEITNIRIAHEKEGAVWAQLIPWLKEAAKTTDLREKDVEAKLEALRQNQEDYFGVSFEPIVGYAGNGAIVHYRAALNNSAIKPDGLILIDTGGQYLQGTTDLTRVMALGQPSEEMRTRYTQVLMGHIDLAMAMFPDGVTGAPLDMLARQHLYKDGVDFAHGTGHGVGMFLNVHEGPCNISPVSKEPLKPGMLISNEPGYYKEGEYGIRIENLILVQKAAQSFQDGRARFYFETVSLVPFERELINKDMLSDAHIEWINAYHSEVFTRISPRVEHDTNAMTWLKQETASL